MNLKSMIIQSKLLKNIAHRLLMPKGEAYPRIWVKWFVHPFIMQKGKKARIRKVSRMDVFPFHPFRLGSRSTIESYCTVNNAVGKVTVGNNTRIGIGSTLIGPVSIGDDVRLAQNVVATGLNHNYTDPETPISEQGTSQSEIYIGDGTWIGSNSVILPGVYIGKHCVVGAGSVVTKNIPSYCVGGGNPARIIKKFNKDTGKWERSVA